MIVLLSGQYSSLVPPLVAAHDRAHFRGYESILLAFLRWVEPVRRHSRYLLPEEDHLDGSYHQQDAQYRKEYRRYLVLS